MAQKIPGPGGGNGGGIPRRMPSAPKGKKVNPAVKEAQKISARRSASTKHPSGMYINKETGAIYDKGMRTVKRATVTNATKAKGRAIKNSRAGADVKKITSNPKVRKAAGAAAGGAAGAAIIKKAQYNSKKYEENINKRKKP